MIHSDDAIKAIFAKYRESLTELERQKGILDTEIGLQLESVAADQGGKIQCEILEDPDNGGVMVSYYRIDPLNTAKPDVEPEAVKSVWYRGELYYRPDELEEITAVEEDFDEVDQETIERKLQGDDSIVEPAVEPQGPPGYGPGPAPGGPGGPGVASNN